MDEKKPQEGNNTDLVKCPFCSCYFCNDEDLQRHMKSFGTSKAEHFEAFRKTHGRLEHGSFNSSE